MTRPYLDLLRDVRDNGVRRGDRTGTGTLSIFGAQMRFDLREGFPLLTTKRVPFRWVAEELFWFLSGSTFEPDLAAKGVDIWKEWATEEQCASFGREEGDLGPTYGKLWRDFGAGSPVQGTDKLNVTRGVDQIARILYQIQYTPNSRRIILTGWDPRTADQVALPPCHTLTQFYVHEGRLSAHLYQRSADMFLGVPFNIASYALLTHLLAHVTGLEVGDFVHSFGDTHIYLNHLDQAEEQLSRKPGRLPTLLIKPFPPGKAIDNLLSIKYEDLILSGYKPQKKIPAPVAV